MTIDVMSNSPFFTSKCKAISKENPVVNQTSLRAFFHAPLHLVFDWLICLFGCSDY